MAGLRQAPTGRRRGPLTLHPSLGSVSRGRGPAWTPTAPRGGWELDTVHAAAEAYAAEHAAALVCRPEAVAWSAFLALAHALDTAAGRSVSHRDSLRRLDLVARVSRVD